MCNQLATQGAFAAKECNHFIFLPKKVPIIWLFGKWVGMHIPPQKGAKDLAVWKVGRNEINW